MADDRIYRKIVLNKCTVEYVNEKNEVKEKTIDIYGDLTTKRLETKAKKKVGTNRLLLKSHTKEISWASMSMEKFVKYCDYIDKEKGAYNGK